MKKIALILALCLTITTFFSSYLAILAHAEEEPVHDILTEEAHAAYLDSALSVETTYASGINEYDSFLASYYDNLTYNIGMNYKGSCGYVGLAMLLSYYDTYLNDNLVPEQYDIKSIGEGVDTIERRNSPGVLRDVVINPNNYNDKNYGINLNASDYYSYVVSISDVSLHAKLITIGANRGYYNFSNSKNPASTFFLYRLNVLNDYLSDVVGLENDDYQITYLNYENDYSKSNLVREFAIAQVQAGKPVLLSISGYPGGHVVVAYDYDPTTDSLFCHMGWGANKTHVTPESELFTTYKTALTIDFNTEHSHSDNYGVTTITNNIPTTEYYCYDDCRILTYNHLHSYDNHFESYTNTQHKAYCWCGEYIKVPHQVINGVCTLCGESHEHLFTYTWLSNTTHQETCFCGEEGNIKPHVVDIDSFAGGTMYATCLLCGGRVSRAPQIILSQNQLPHTENGSFILSSGIIVLVDEDIEAYFNGTLEFIYPDDNYETE